MELACYQERIRMELLYQNLQSLRKRNAALAQRIEHCPRTAQVTCMRANSGAFTLQIGDRLEASLEDPEQEARQLARLFLDRVEQTESTRLVLFGLGVHTLRFLQAFQGSLLVIEPSLEFCRAVLEQIDLRDVLGKIDLLIEDDPAMPMQHPVFTNPERGLFLAHPTAKRRATKLHDALASHFIPGGTAHPLNIAVIPPLFGGSLPVALGCARGLRELGHYVRKIDLTPFWPGYQTIVSMTNDPRLASKAEAIRSSLVRLIGETLLASFELDPPDLVLAVAQAPLDPDILKRMGRMGITRAFWFCEDFRVMPYWKGLTHCYDTFFHVQPDEFSQPLRDAGGYGVPLPMAFDPAVTRPIRLEPDAHARYAADLSFIGAAYHNRLQWLPALFDLGLQLYGVEWPEHPPFLAVMPEPNVRQSSEACNRIFNATKVNLNLHSSPWCDGVNPAGDYLNPRTFELAGARAFQLVDERNELSRSFEAGVELETYRDIAECRKKIRYFLDHEDERDEIAENGYRRAIREHTYRHRMEIAIDALRAGPIPLAPRRPDLPTVGAILDSARDEPELTEILARVDPGRVFDGDAITEAVGQGQGSLSREEKILLFMRESKSEVVFLNQIGQTA